MQIVCWCTRVLVGPRVEDVAMRVPVCDHQLLYSYADLSAWFIYSRERFDDNGFGVLYCILCIANQ